MLIDLSSVYLDKTTDSVTLKFLLKHLHVVIFQYNGLYEQAIDLTILLFTINYLFWPEENI